MNDIDNENQDLKFSDLKLIFKDLKSLFEKKDTSLIGKH